MHSLILNENYNAREGDFVFCYLCGEILLNKSCVYSCSSVSSTSTVKDECATFFLHKSCAQLPQTITHPNNLPTETFKLFASYPTILSVWRCLICKIKIKWCSCYNNFDVLCLTCAIPVKNQMIGHPCHNHQLTLLERLASFQCKACHTVATDFSYMCYTCQFWIHEKCANLPTLLECKHYHKHPLVLAYSLPGDYSKFQQFCKICKKELEPRHWLYYCANCRFFAHTKCAKSSTKIPRECEADFDEHNLVHLPTPDELSLNVIMQQFIKETVISLREEDTDVTPPDHMRHWAHQQHPLVLKNKNPITTMDNNLSGEVADADEDLMLMCDGCARSISLRNDVFYECNHCRYFLHQYCAQFPKEMHHHLEGKLVGTQPSVFEYWDCHNCYSCSNGIQLKSAKEYCKFHLGCACLPKIIKHEAHHHPLMQIFEVPLLYIDICEACDQGIMLTVQLVFRCISCNFYIHGSCALIDRIWAPRPKPP